MIVSLHQNIGLANYRPRKHLLSDTGAEADEVLAVSEASVPFERAFFYGLRAVEEDGSGLTANAGAVYLGEKDPSGKVYCVDAVANDPEQPLLVQAPSGAKLDLKDFFVRIPTVGDRVFVKYQ